MTYLFASVKIKHQINPFRPQTWIDWGHADVILWAPPHLPECFGFYPNSPARVLPSAVFPQRARLLRQRSFGRVPTWWKWWGVPQPAFAQVKDYLEGVATGCKDGSVSYHALRFNCLHVVHRCLQIAGLSPVFGEDYRVAPWLLLPDKFVSKVMPTARFSVMQHAFERTKGLSGSIETSGLGTPFSRDRDSA